MYTRTLYIVYLGSVCIIYVYMYIVYIYTYIQYTCILYGIYVYVQEEVYYNILKKVR